MDWNSPQCCEWRCILKAQLAQPFTTSRKKDRPIKERKYKSDILSRVPVQHSLEAIRANRNAVQDQIIDLRPKIQHLTDLISTCTSSLKTEEAEWLTSKEAAQYLRVSEGTLRNLVSNGKVPYVKLGRSNRYSRKELRQLLLSKKRGVFYEC